MVLRQLGWTVFEPAGDPLRAGIRRHLDQLLGELFDAGAFAGGTPAESWFVDVGVPEDDRTRSAGRADRRGARPAAGVRAGQGRPGRRWRAGAAAGGGRVGAACGGGHRRDGARSRHRGDRDRDGGVAVADVLARAFRFRVVLTSSPTRAGARRPVHRDGLAAWRRRLRRMPRPRPGDWTSASTSRAAATTACVQRAGRAKVPASSSGGACSTRRAAGSNGELWQWLQPTSLDGVRPLRRYDGTVRSSTSVGDQPVATWTFTRGLPAKLVGPQLNARTGEVAIEELQIAHEGLRMEVP